MDNMSGERGHCDKGKASCSLQGLFWYKDKLFIVLRIAFFWYRRWRVDVLDDGDWVVYR